jgi:quinoprotein glucose dehydrogenase
VAAWTFHTGETVLGTDAEAATSLEATPIVVDGTLYFSTPLGRVFALDPETGRERWRFDAGVDRSLHFGDFTSRGVSTWLDSAAAPDARCRRRIILATIDARLIALDALSGARCAGFGVQGAVDLRRGLRNAPFETEEYEETSPPAVINGVVIVGSGVADNNRTDAASGEVRGFDARSGALRWTWDPVPQDPGDPAFGTWIGPHAHGTGAANAWSVLAGDPARDLVLVPTGSASPDYFGGERLGANRYANSIVALQASTGKMVWQFQTVHHDLWDYDNASPPLLALVPHGDGAVPAVLQATKTGQLFILHRDSGDPLFPVEERPVPPSSVPGEHASPTQPFSRLPSLSPAGLAPDDILDGPPSEAAACRTLIAGLQNRGGFTPPSLQGTLVRPSNIGGAHWGGLAYDPSRAIVVVPVNRVAAEVQLIPRADYQRLKSRPGSGARLSSTSQYTDMRGTPYVMRRQILRSPMGLPCTRPPWGALVAMSLRTGRRV